MTKPVEKLVTKESLRKMIDDSIAAGDDKWFHVVGHALVVLYKRQTIDEQRRQTTDEANGCGFNGIDAQFGTECAERYINHRLSRRQAEVWIKGNRIFKYHAQLNEAAIAKKASKTQ